MITSSSSDGKKGCRFNKGTPAATAKSQPLKAPEPLAFKKGVTVLNTPGTIDADYRGEIKVILINLSNEEFIVEDGERIAQMIIARHERAELNQVNELSETTRGAGGFGHTGKK